jgi:hypothetical protein
MLYERMFPSLTSQVIEAEFGSEVLLKKKLKDYFFSFLSSLSGIIKAELDDLYYKIGHQLMHGLSNEVKKKCLYEMFDWDLEDSGGEVESRRCECFIASDADFVSQMLKNSADGDSNTAKANKFSEVYAFKLKMSIFVSIK